MPPRLVSDDGRNVVIRPLCLSAEEEIAAYVMQEKGLPIPPPPASSICLTKGVKGCQ